MSTPNVRPIRAGRPRRDGALVPLHEVAHTVLAESAKPLTAYALLARLEERLGRHLSPPTVYRALGYLQAMGAIARIQSLNAFLSVDPSEDRPTRVFLLCGSCGTAQEVSDRPIERHLEGIASAHAFAVVRGVIELEGMCHGCGASRAEAAGS